MEGGTDKVTEYLYDADGNRLIGRTPTDTTLYLGAHGDHRSHKGATTAKATRYYDLGGGHQAVQHQRRHDLLHPRPTTTAPPNSPSTPATRRMQPAPHHAVRRCARHRARLLARHQGLRRRHHRHQPPVSPTSAPASTTPPPAASVASTRSSTATDPQQINGYTYANNNPLTFSDPAGTEIGSKPNSCQYDLEVLHQERTAGSRLRRQDRHGRLPPGQHLQALTGGEEAVGGFVHPGHERHRQNSGPVWSPRMNGESTEDSGTTRSTSRSTEGSACFRCEGCRQAYLYVLHGGRATSPRPRRSRPPDCVLPRRRMQTRRPRPSARGNVIRDAVASARAGLPGRSRPAALRRPCNSFVPGTEVLMADGTTKPIEDVEDRRQGPGHRPARPARPPSRRSPPRSPARA